MCRRQSKPVIKQPVIQEESESEESSSEEEEEESDVPPARGKKVVSDVETDDTL